MAATVDFLSDDLPLVPGWSEPLSEGGRPVQIVQQLGLTNYSTSYHRCCEYESVAIATDS
jgi:hypothetical protein